MEKRIPTINAVYCTALRMYVCVWVQRQAGTQARRHATRPSHTCCPRSLSCSRAERITQTLTVRQRGQDGKLIVALDWFPLASQTGVSGKTTPNHQTLYHALFSDFICPCRRIWMPSQMVSFPLYIYTLGLEMNGTASQTYEIAVLGLSRLGILSPYFAE